MKQMGETKQWYILQSSRVLRSTFGLEIYSRPLLGIVWFVGLEW